MKVLFWAENFWPLIGGVETFSRQLIFPMQQRGHVYNVVTSGRMADSGLPEEIEGIPVWRFPFSPVLERRDLSGIMSISKQLDDMIQNLHPDLIHLNTTLPSIFYYLRNAAAVKIPTLLTLHNPISTIRQQNGIVRKLMQTVTHVAGVSRSSLDLLRAEMPEISMRTSLILNALETPRIPPAPLPFGPPVILCVGRLTAQKGFDTALQSFALVRQHVPKIRLLMAGDGELRQELESESLRLGLGEAVTFLGKVSHEEVYSLLNRATLLLMPSRYEPFGLVALEAAQMARPVVASRVDGLSEVVVDGETGLLSEPDHWEGFARAILSLIEDGGKCERMGRQARKRAEKEFSAGPFIEAYDRLYRQLC